MGKFVNNEIINKRQAEQEKDAKIASLEEQNAQLMMALVMKGVI